MRADLLEVKREAKVLVSNPNFQISRDSQGEYSVEQHGKQLACGYNVTDCRIYAIESLIDEVNL